MAKHYLGITPDGEHIELSLADILDWCHHRLPADLITKIESCATLRPVEVKFGGFFQ